MKFSSGLLAIVSLSIPAAHGALIPIGAVPSTGNGLGPLQTVLTFTSKGSGINESGCVGAGAGGVAVTGSSKCPAGFSGGDEQATNKVYAVSALGLTDFRNLQVVFNASEPQNAGDQSIVLQNLALTAFSSTGALLQSYTLGVVYNIADSSLGSSKAGFGFTLGLSDADALNALLVPGANVYLGASANATDATGGHETVSFRVNSANSVTAVPVISSAPEPGPAVMLGSGLMLLGLSTILRHVRSRKA